MMNESPYPENFHMENVPYKYQNENNWCGPASLAMVLSYWGVYVSQETIADSVINLDNLTKCENLAKYAENFGFNTSDGTTTIEELKENVSNGYPIIVLQRDFPVNHFRVVVGYNEENIITHNPLYVRNYSVYLNDYPDYPTQYYHIPYDNFVDLWELDGFQNEFVTVYSLTTPVRDNIPPTISIISPTNGQTLDNGIVEISWEGEDESGIERCEVKIDNWDWNPITNTSKLFWESEEGEHTIYVRAVDRSGNLKECSVTVTINMDEIIEPEPTDYTIPIVIGSVTSVLVAVLALTLYERSRR